MSLRTHPEAACSPGVLEACVIAVASELTDLEKVVPGLSSVEVALIAQGAVEAAELEPRLSELLWGQEPPCGDWALLVLAALREELAMLEQQRQQRRGGEVLFALTDRAFELVAASSDRSPVVFYGEVLTEAAQSLVLRGDPLGLTRQLECVAEELKANSGIAVSALRELAFMKFQLGKPEEALLLLAALHRHHPSDVWSFNHLATMCPALGLASLGTLAAERGLELVKREGDPERLARQFEQLRSEAGGRKDRSDAPAHAVEQLKAALREDFSPPSSTGIAELAHRLVPELTSTRVKTLPRMAGLLPSPSWPGAPERSRAGR